MKTPDSPAPHSGRPRCNDPLDRLLARAATAPSRPIPPLDPRCAGRILAHWRDSLQREAIPCLALWRWGVASAFGVSMAALTALWVAPSPTWDAADPYVATEQSITLLVQSAWLNPEPTP